MNEKNKGVATQLWKKKQSIAEEIESQLLVQNYQLDALDILTAEKMASDSADLFVLIAFFCAAFRRGHLCI